MKSLVLWKLLAGVPLYSLHKQIEESYGVEPAHSSFVIACTMQYL